MAESKKRLIKDGVRNYHRVEYAVPGISRHFLAEAISRPDPVHLERMGVFQGLCLVIDRIGEFPDRRQGQNPGLKGSAGKSFLKAHRMIAPWQGGFCQKN